MVRSLSTQDSTIPASDAGYILAVDDTPYSLRLLSEYLVREGYSVRSAPSGEVALRTAKAEPPWLILLDVTMPGLDGFQVCRVLKQDPDLRDVPVIFVSGLSDMQDKVKGFEIGAVDYVTKPFQPAELLARVRNHMELYRLRSHLEDMVEERTRSLKENEVRLKNNLLETITAVSDIVELRDPYTAGHQRRVASLVDALAGELGMAEEQKEGLRLAAVVHDIGKITVPSGILSKPKDLNEAEFAVIRQHPDFGCEILRTVDFAWPVADMVRQHHERLDGSGYPRGLCNNEIMLEARVLAVADVVEAMASHRPYRAALSIDATLEGIEGSRGSKLDADVVDATLRLFRDKGFAIGD
jgi:putative two-component system response regulator